MDKLTVEQKLETSYCIPLWLRDEQVKLSTAKVKGRIEPHQDLKKDAIAIVCFGPSLADTWEKIKDFKYIMSCSGSHKFLLEKGIVPTYHCEVDPREHKVTLIGTPHKDVEYLISSTCHPKVFDLLEGYNVKLWHVFANDEDAMRALPANEWALTGGCSVGLRAMTIARFLGFTDMHIFGMDGCEGKTGKHAAFHPNQPKQAFELEYDGKVYMTTPSILEAAKGTWHELNQMPDVKATFYGEGLVQAMAKNYVPKYVKKGKAMIAFNKPELISKTHADLNYKLHNSNPSYGAGGAKHKDTVLKLAESIKSQSILDYGCGKGLLAKCLDFPIWEYDPAIPEKSGSPKPADLVICTDVLEHIEPDKLDFVLGDLQRCVKKIGYFVISTRPAGKTYADGTNTHLIQQGKDWWNGRLAKYFEVGSIMDKGQELHCVLGVKKPSVNLPVDTPQITDVSRDGTEVQFSTPNITTKWRANTLFTKEPITIEWIDTFQPGEIMVDVGANMGGYTIWAAKHKKVKVIAFEPEADNYALLQKNIILNDADAVAYCAALSNEARISTLYLSQRGVGGSCHSFNSEETEIRQGCIGLRLDDLEIHVDHIKIDVDGFEPQVVEGALKTLKNVKSLLIEVNTNLDTHKIMLQTLKDLGFEFDPLQVERSMRKEGAFKGVAEHLFTKTIKKDALPYSRIAEKIKESPLDLEPFNYLYVEDIFPKDFYTNIMNNMPTNYEEIEKTRGTKGYPKRFTASAEGLGWGQIRKSLLSGSFKKALLDKFGLKDDDYTEDLILIRDHPGYSIPPHTDSLSKIISVLFYLPKEETGEGTSLFVPKKKGFKSVDGKHYKFEDFKRVKTLPFKPNSMLAFARTDDSFHGVEPCTGIRDVLLYNIKVK